MPLLTPHVPKGLIELMKNLAKEVLRDKPTNIYEFAVVHFEKLIEQRDGSLNKNYEQFVAFEALFEGQQRFAVPASYGFICQRPKAKSQPNVQSKKSKNDMMESFKAMESINEEQVLNENLYNDERYQKAVYVIQRYYRRYVTMKKKSSSTSTLTATTAAIIIQRTMRRLFSNKIKLKTGADSAKRDDAQQDDADNISEAASYTSSSTIQMLAESQEGRENQLSGRGAVLDGVASSDGATEFKEQMTVAQQNSPIAEEDSEVPPTAMDKKSIDDGNDIRKPTHQDEVTTLDHPTTALDDTSTAHIGKLSTVIGSNDHQNSLHTNNVEIDSNSSDPTTQIKPQPDAVAVGIYPLNFPQSLGATPETLPATSPRQEAQDEFMVRLQDNAYADNNMAFAYQGDLHVRKFDPDNGESLKIYDRFYHDRDDPDFSDSLNESTMERDSLENDDLEADSLDSNENGVRMSGIAKREARQDDGSLYEDTDELQEEEEAVEQDVRRLVELERAPTYLYGIHPTRTPIVERKNLKNRRSAEGRTMDDDDFKETASSLRMVNAVMEDKSPEESLESKESTSEESSVTAIENTTGMTKELEFAEKRDAMDKDLRDNGKQTNDSKGEVTNTHRYKATLEEEQPYELEVPKVMKDGQVNWMNTNNASSLVQQMETIQLEETQSKPDKQRMTFDTRHHFEDVPDKSIISEAESTPEDQNSKEFQKLVPNPNPTISDQGHTVASKTDSQILSLTDETSNLTDFKEDHEISTFVPTINEIETPIDQSKETKDRQKGPLDGNTAPPISDSPDNKNNQSNFATSPVEVGGVEKLEVSSSNEVLKSINQSGEDSSLDHLTSTKLEHHSQEVKSKHGDVKDLNGSQPDFEVDSEPHSVVLPAELKTRIEISEDSENNLQDSAKSLELVLKSLKNETKSIDLQKNDPVLDVPTETSDQLSLANDSNGQIEYTKKSDLGVVLKEHNRTEDGSEGLPDQGKSEDLISIDHQKPALNINIVPPTKLSEETKPFGDVNEVEKSKVIAKGETYRHADTGLGENRVLIDLGENMSPIRSDEKRFKKTPNTSTSMHPEHHDHEVESQLRELHSLNKNQPDFEEEMELHSEAIQHKLDDVPASLIHDSNNNVEVHESTNVAPDFEADSLLEEQVIYEESLKDSLKSLEQVLKGLKSGNKKEEDKLGEAPEIEKTGINSKKIAIEIEVEHDTQSDQKSRNRTEPDESEKFGKKSSDRLKRSLNKNTILPFADRESSISLDQLETTTDVEEMLPDRYTEAKMSEAISEDVSIKKTNLAAENKESVDSGFDMTTDGIDSSSRPRPDSSNSMRPEHHEQPFDSHDDDKNVEGYEKKNVGLSFEAHTKVEDQVVSEKSSSKPIPDPSNSIRPEHVEQPFDSHDGNKNIDTYEKKNAGLSSEVHTIVDDQVISEKSSSKPKSDPSNSMRPEYHEQPFDSHDDDKNVEGYEKKNVGLSSEAHTIAEDQVVSEKSSSKPRPDLSNSMGPEYHEQPFDSHDDDKNVEGYEKKNLGLSSEAHTIVEDQVVSEKSSSKPIPDLSNSMRPEHHEQPCDTHYDDKNVEEYEKKNEGSSSEAHTKVEDQVVSEKSSSKPVPDPSNSIQPEHHDDDKNVEGYEKKNVGLSSEAHTKVEDQVVSEKSSSKPIPDPSNSIRPEHVEQPSDSHDDNENIEEYEKKNVGSSYEAHTKVEDQMIAEDSLKDSAKSLEQILKNLKNDDKNDKEYEDMHKDYLLGDEAAQEMHSEQVNTEIGLKEEIQSGDLSKCQTNLEASKSLNVSQAKKPLNDTKTSKNEEAEIKTNSENITEDVHKYNKDVKAQQGLESSFFTKDEQLTCDENLKVLEMAKKLLESSGEDTANTLASEEMIIHSAEELIEESRKVEDERSEGDCKTELRKDSKDSGTLTNDSISKLARHERSVEENLEETDKVVDVLAESYSHHKPSHIINSETQLTSGSIEPSDENKNDEPNGSLTEEIHLNSGESKKKAVSELDTFSKISSTAKTIENTNENIQKLVEDNQRQPSTPAGNFEGVKSKALFEPRNESSCTNLEENNINSHEGASEESEKLAIIQAKKDLETASTSHDSKALTKSLVDNTLEITLPSNQLPPEVENVSKYLETFQIPELSSNARNEENMETQARDSSSNRNFINEEDKMISNEIRKPPGEEEPNDSKIDNKPSPHTSRISTLVCTSEALNDREKVVKEPIENIDKLGVAFLESSGIAGNEERLNESFESLTETQKVSKLGGESSYINSVSKHVGLLSGLEPTECDKVIIQIDDIKPKKLSQSSNPLDILSGSNGTSHDLKDLTLIDLNYVNEEENKRILGSKADEKVTEIKDVNLEHKSIGLLNSSKVLKVLEHDNDLGTEKLKGITDKGEISTNLKTGFADEQEMSNRIELEVKANSELETKSTFPRQLSKALSFPVYKSNYKITDLIETDQKLNKDEILNEEIEEPQNVKESVLSAKSEPNIEENLEDEELFNYFGKPIKFDEDMKTDEKNTSETPEPPRSDPSSIMRQFSSGDVRSKLPKVEEETKDEAEAFERGEVIASENLRQFNEILEGLELQQINEEPEEQVHLLEESSKILNQLSSIGDNEVPSQNSTYVQSKDMETKVLPAKQSYEDERDPKPLSTELKVKEDKNLTADNSGKKNESENYSDDIKDLVQAVDGGSLKGEGTFDSEIKEMENVSEKEIVERISNETENQTEVQGETKGQKDSKPDDHFAAATEMPLTKAQKYEQESPNEINTALKSESALEPILEQTTKTVHELKQSVENEETNESMEQVGDEKSISNKLASDPPYQEIKDLRNDKLGAMDEKPTSNKVTTSSLVLYVSEDIPAMELNPEEQITATKVHALNSVQEKITKHDEIQIKSVSDIKTPESLLINENSLKDKEDLDETLKTEPELGGGSESLQTDETSCEKSHNTSADLSSLGQDLDFFEYTIDYLKSATVQLSAMDKLFDEGMNEKSKEANQSDNNVQNQAATIIQSAIRGYQVRKALNKKDVIPELQEKDLQLLIDEETQNKPYSEEVFNHAAVIIQSAIRGYQVRKASNNKKVKPESKRDIEVKSGDSDDNQQPVVLIHHEKRLSHPIVVVHLAEDLPEEDEEYEGQNDINEQHEPKDVNRESHRCEEKNVTEVLDQTDIFNEAFTCCDQQNEDRALNSEDKEEDGLKHDQHNVEENLPNLTAGDQETNDQKLIKDAGKTVKGGSANPTYKEETPHSSSGQTRKLVDARPTKTPSAPPRRQHLPNSKKNQFARKGRSISVIEQSKIPNVFDLEAIKKELLSKKVKTPPQSGGKKKKKANSRDHRRESSHDDQNGLTYHKKSQKTLDKASEVSKTTAEAQNVALGHGEPCSEINTAKKFLAETSESIALSNIARKPIEDIDEDKQANGSKPDLMQIFEEPIKMQSEEANQIELSSKGREEENDSNLNINETQSLGADVENKSATMIQKTFRGYRTRRSISASGMRHSKKQLNDIKDNNKETEGDLSLLTTNLSGSKSKLKEEEPQTLSIFDSLKKEVDEFRNSVIDKSATTIQKTFRGYKTRKDLRVEKGDSALPSKHVPLEPVDVREASSKSEDSREQATESKDREKLDDILSEEVKDNSDKNQKVGRQLASLTKTLSIDSREHAATYKFEKTAPHDEISVTYDSFDVEGYQNAALDKSATKIQKTYRGYKTRKDLRPKIFEEIPSKKVVMKTYNEEIKITPLSDANSDEILVKKESVHENSNLNSLVDNPEDFVEKTENDMETTNDAEKDPNSVKEDDTIKALEKMIVGHKELKKSEQNQDQFKDKVWNESATTIQKTYKGYKTRKDLKTAKYHTYEKDKLKIDNSNSNEDSTKSSIQPEDSSQTFQTKIEISERTGLDTADKQKDVTQAATEHIYSLSEVQNTLRTVSAGPLLEAAASTIQKAYRDYHTKKDMSHSLAPIKSYSHGSKRDNALKEAAENSDESSIFIGADTSFDLSDTESFDIKSDLKSTDSPHTPVNCDEKHETIPPKISTSSTLAMIIHSDNHDLENDSAKPIEASKENSLYIPQGIIRKRSIIEPIAPPLEDVLQAFEISSVEQKPQWYVGDELIVPSDGSNTPTAPSSFPIPLVSSSRFEQSNNIDARVEYLPSDLQLIPSSISSAVVSTSSLLLDKDTEMHDEIIPKQLSNYSRPVSANEEQRKSEENLNENQENQETEKVVKNEDDKTLDIAAFSPDTEDTLQLNGADPFSPRVGVEGLSGAEDVVSQSTVTDLCKDCADGVHRTGIALLGHKCNEDSIENIKTQVANVEDVKAGADSSQNHFDEIKHFVLAEEQNITDVRDSENNESEICGHKTLTEQNVGDQMSNDQSDDGKMGHIVTIEVNDQKHEETVKSCTETPSISFVPPSSEEETAEQEAGQHGVVSGSEVIEKCLKEEDVDVINESDAENKSSDHKSEETSKSCQNLNDSKEPQVDDGASQMEADDNGDSFKIVEGNVTAKMNDETGQKADIAKNSFTEQNTVNEDKNEDQSSAATSKIDTKADISRTSDVVGSFEPIINDATIEETEFEPDALVEELSENEKVVLEGIKQRAHDLNGSSSEKSKINENENESDKAIEEVENFIIEDVTQMDTDKFQTLDTHDLDKATSHINTEEAQSVDILNSGQTEDHSKSQSEQESIKGNLKFEDNFEDNIIASGENMAPIDSEIIPRKQTSLSSELVNEEIGDRSKQIENIPSEDLKSISKQESSEVYNKETPSLTQSIENSNEQKLKSTSQEESDEVKSAKEMTEYSKENMSELSKDIETKTDESKIENETEESLLVKKEKQLDSACSDNTLTEEVNHLTSHASKPPPDSIKEVDDLERIPTGESEIDSKAEENIRFEEKKCFEALAEEAEIGSLKIENVDSKIGEHLSSEENKSFADEDIIKDKLTVGKGPTEERGNLNLTDLEPVGEEPGDTKAAHDMSTMDEPINPSLLKDELTTEIFEQPTMSIKEEELEDDEHQDSKIRTQTEQKGETANLQEDLEIASKLLDAAISDSQNNVKLLEDSKNDPEESDASLFAKTDKNENLDSLGKQSSENQESPSEADKAIQKKLDKLIEDSSSPIADTTSSIQPQDLPTENCLEEVVEVPCIKKVVPLTPLAAISDQDESELESTTTKADSTTTTQAYDETSENDAIEIPTSIHDNLEAVAEKLWENEAVVARMHQRRASEQKISSDSIDQPPAFDEPICEPIKPMQELQNSSSTELEDEIVLRKLQREDTTRESSAQSESVVFGGSTSQSIESHDTFNENLDFKPFHRMNTISTDRSSYKPTSLLFKSVTIDDTVKYIDPEKSTEESAGSFHMDDETSADVRKKIMAYSVSEADSDYYESSDRNGYPHDDFNISTALDTFPSTDTDTTIVSAATKIQAGARGFLTRRRLRRASVGTKSSLTEETKTSFGNDAIGESLDRLVEEEVASRMPKVQYHRQTGVNSLPSALGHSDEETYTVHLSPTREEINANDYESGDLKLAEMSATATSPPHGVGSSIDGQREVPHLYTSSEDDVNGGIEQGDESAQLLSNLDATLAARRLTLQRGDAMHNDSTPDEENGNGKHVDATKSVRTTTDPVLIQQRTMVELTTTSTMTVSTERRHYSDEATNIKMEKIRWFAMRQNSMPVQIDSEVFRVLPKHMRKRIKSAEGEKKKRIRLPRD